MPKVRALLSSLGLIPNLHYIKKLALKALLIENVTLAGIYSLGLSSINQSINLYKQIAIENIFRPSSKFL